MHQYLIVLKYHKGPAQTNLMGFSHFTEWLEYKPHYNLNSYNLCSPYRYQSPKPHNVYKTYIYICVFCQHKQDFKFIHACNNNNSKSISLTLGHSRRTSQWCNPCNLNSQRRGRICSLCWASRNNETNWSEDIV